MKTFPAGITAEAAKKTGAKPVWILKLTVSGQHYYIANNTVDLPAFGTAADWPVATAITTKPWAKSWGSIQEGITNYLAEFHVSNISFEGLVDPEYPNNLEYLATVHIVENSPVQLFMWFMGCSDAPQLMFQGRVRDVSIQANTSVSFDIQDESLLLERRYIGTKLSAADYPYADLQDIGKVKPIVFNSVAKLPALCIEHGAVSTLVTAINASATALTVSDANRFKGVSTIIIDQEHMNISSIVGGVINVTRAAGGTTAAAHSKAASVIEKRANPLVFLVADHPVTSFGNLFSMINGVPYDVTSFCTTYTGQGGAEHSTYPGKAIVTIADFITIPKQTELTINDPLALADPGHDHTTGNMSFNQDGGLPLWTGSSPDQSLAVTFPNQPGNYITQWVTISVQVGVSGGSDAPTIWICGVNMGAGFDVGGSFTVTPGTDSHEVRAVRNGSTLVTSIHVYEARRMLTFEPLIAANTTAASKADPARLEGNQNIETVALTSLYVDVTRTVTQTEPFDTILTDAGLPALTVPVTIPAMYALSGAITEYKTALFWLNYWALHYRSWFKLTCGKAKLIYREEAPAFVKSIRAIKVNKDGKAALSRTKTAISEVINRINVFCGLDLTKGKSATSYATTISREDAASQALYGVQEQANLFYLDFYQQLDAAAWAIKDFYIEQYRDRHWLCTFDCFLDNANIEFGDCIHIPFLPHTPVGYVIRAEHYPGDASRLDTVKFTVLARGITP